MYICQNNNLLCPKNSYKQQQFKATHMNFKNLICSDLTKSAQIKSLKVWMFLMLLKFIQFSIF